MFTIRQDHSFTWPVQVAVPGDGGKHRTETFQARFREIDQDRLNEILADTEGAVDAALLTEIVIGWEGVRDEHKDEVPFDTETLELLIKVPYVRAAMAEAFMDAMTGRKRKN